MKITSSRHFDVFVLPEWCYRSGVAGKRVKQIEGSSGQRGVMYDVIIGLGGYLVINSSLAWL
jgi:hypothetical protein